MKKSEFCNRINSELSYDGTPDEKCPHCGAVLREGLRHFDKTWQISANAVHLMGVKRNTPYEHWLVDELDEYLQDAWPNNTSEEDCAMIADWMEDHGLIFTHEQ